MRRSAIKKDDRLFSNSSATGSRHLADLASPEGAPDQGSDEAAEDSQQ